MDCWPFKKEKMYSLVKRNSQYNWNDSETPLNIIIINSIILKSFLSNNKKYKRIETKSWNEIFLCLGGRIGTSTERIRREDLRAGKETRQRTG